MPKLQGFSADRIAEYFVSYLFEDFRGSRHVRRVAAWAGVIILGIQRGAGNQWKIGGGSEMRQLWFRHAGRQFKVKYLHTLSNGKIRSGGIKIVEVLPGKGRPEGRTVVDIRDLREAEDFYNRAPIIFQTFVRQSAA